MKEHDFNWEQTRLEADSYASFHLVDRAYQAGKSVLLELHPETHDTEGSSCTVQWSLKRKINRDTFYFYFRLCT